MADRSQHDGRWALLGSGTLIAVGFAVIVVWSARSYGRTVAIAFAINWILMAWAISRNSSAPVVLGLLWPRGDVNPSSGPDC